MQVAAVKPQRRLLGRLPHVSLFALPGTWVLGRVRPQPPDLADLVSHVRRDQVGSPAVHRAISRRIHDQISLQ